MANKKLNFETVVLICLTMSFIFGDFIVGAKSSENRWLAEG